jgi:hypothetical protein
LVVGDPAHRIRSFVWLARGGIYVVTGCGMNFETGERPRQLGDALQCVMCFSDLGELAA